MTVVQALSSRQNLRFLAFGFLCAVASGFGQTFFISLFVPSIESEFLLSKTEFGSMYGAMTVLAALLLTALGGLVDRVELKRVSALPFVVLLLGALALALASSLWVLALGILGLRFGGQGLMTHLYGTTLARVFDAARGRALGVASMGHPLSEAIFPALLSLALGYWGWRGAALGIVVAALCFYGLLLLLLWGMPSKPSDFLKDKGPKKLSEASDWDRARLFRSPQAAMLVPFWVFSGFALTGTFFHQGVLATEHGWTLDSLARAFIAFAIARGLFSPVGGFLVDRFGSERILLFAMIPLFLGLLCPIFIPSIAGAWVYLGFSGMSAGLYGASRTSFLAETFGTQNLGSIKSVVMPITVLSTALSPPLFGAFIDGGISMDTILLGTVCAGVIATVFGWIAMRWLRRSNEQI